MKLIDICLFEILGAMMFGYGISISRGSDFVLQLTIIYANLMVGEMCGAHFHLYITTYLYCLNKISLKRTIC